MRRATLLAARRAAAAAAAAGLASTTSTPGGAAALRSAGIATTTTAAWTAPPRFAAARTVAAPATPHARSLYIQTQETPNPASLMFLPGQAVLGVPDASAPSEGSAASPAPPASAHFSSAREAAAASPLAAALFRVDGVTAVFLGSDFLTVTKADGAAWGEVKPGVFAAITEHFASGLPALRPLAPGSAPLAPHHASDTAPHPDDSETVAMIKELLDTRIRPAVAEDGGDIAFAGFDADTGTVSLRLQGACSGCPSSAITLKSGIENMLQHYIPEVKQVVEAPPDGATNEGLAHFKRVEDMLST